MAPVAALRRKDLRELFLLFSLRVTVRFLSFVNILHEGDIIDIIRMECKNLLVSPGLRVAIETRKVCLTIEN
jgi:hypothetical protein